MIKKKLLDGFPHHTKLVLTRTQTQQCIVDAKTNSNYFGIIIKKMPKTCVLLEILHPPATTTRDK
jgi:hypothetical protein